jgi:hypothetical protein
MKNLFADFWFQIALTSGLLFGTLINDALGALIWFAYSVLLIWHKPTDSSKLSWE